jgi:proteic killer suppression protein
VVEVRHDDKDLEELEFDPKCRTRWAPAIVKAFRKRMQQLRAVHDERDLKGNRGMKFEEMKGDRKGDFSVRLNKQWRLILRVEESGSHRVLVVKSIEDYH